MPTPEKHALLSASSAARWLHCTAAPRFEEQFPENTSEYAEEGRLAHAICELKVLKHFTTSIKPRAFTQKLKKLKESPYYSEEMDRTSDLYLEHLTERAMRYESRPNVAAEVQVDFAEYVPEGFGTCDCIMIGGDTLSITDYKHGKGVPVSAENNPQMRLYALGALKRYKPVYGDSIKKVCMTIDQPRIQAEPSSEVISVEELRAWGEGIKPIAAKAYMGLGTFCPGEHCRFCRGRAKCKARADQNTALEEFKNCVPQNAEEPPLFGQGVLTDAEIGDLLIRGQELVKWYHDLEEYALGTILKGGMIPGWKAVAGRSVRTFSDTDAALTAAEAAGYDRSLLYDLKPKTLTELEKLMGKAEFSDKLGGFVVKPIGKPTLALLTDKREAYSPAAADFAGVTENGGEEK